MAGTLEMNLWTKGFHCLVTGLRCLRPDRTTGPVRVRSVFHLWLQIAFDLEVTAFEASRLAPYESIHRPSIGDRNTWGGRHPRSNNQPARV